MTLNPAFRVGTVGDASFKSDPAYGRPGHQKAVNIKGALRMTMLYAPTEDSHFQSPIDDLTQSPTVFAVWGKGHVGFIGDVNGERGTTKTILAPSGLSEGTELPSVSSGEASPDAEGWCCAACGKQELRAAAVQGEGLRRYGGCQVCYYFSPICQVAHWAGGQKKECKCMRDNYVEDESP